MSVKWERMTAVPLSIAACAFAIPVAGLAGLAVAAAVDDDVRNGWNLRIADGLFSATIAFLILAPAVFALGITACSHVRVRSRLVRYGAPLALIVALTFPATVLVIRTAPDPSSVEERNEPVLRQIAPPPGATSSPPRTFNNSGEWESRSWVTQRTDVLSPETTAVAARRYYVDALSVRGWRTKTSTGHDLRSTYIEGRRGGLRITIALPHVAQRVLITLH